MTYADLMARLEKSYANALQRAQAGVWGLWYVRGGMDPQYASPEARDAMVQDLLSMESHHAAAAFITGWAVHHPEATCQCRMVPTEPPSWDTDQTRWRRPHHREWSWTCPVDRHRAYAQALAARRHERSNA